MLMFKRIISLALALVMMVGMAPHQAFAVEAETFSAVETTPITETVAAETTQVFSVEETAEISVEETAAETTAIPTELPLKTEVEVTESVEVVAEEAMASDSGTWGENLSWTLDDSGVLTVSGTGAMNSGTMPWADQKSSIKAIIIGSGVRTIAARAFSGCPLLASVDIQGTITSIGSGAFAGCTALTEISIPEGLISIGQAAFFECSKLKTVNLPSSLASISVQAFGECTSLTDVHYGGKASEWTAISIASDNDYLINATLHCTLVSQSGNCGDNLQWELEEGVLTIFGTGDMIDFSSDTVPWEAVRNDIICVEIAPGVTSIGKSAFSVCLNLEEVAVSEGVTSIGIAAFLECRKLTAITLPGTLTQIGDYAFCDSGVESVTYGGTIDTWAKISIGEENTELTNAVIRYTGSADAIAGSCGENVNWTLGNGVLTISGSGAMNNYTYSTLPWDDVRESIKEVVVESGVTTIGNSAFSGCTSLSSVSLPDTLESIGVSAFATCTALTEIAIPEGVMSIGNAAFLECAGLSTLYLPKSIETIGAFAFDGCPVSEVYYAGTDEKWELVDVGESNDTLLGATIHHSALCTEGHSYGEWVETKAPACTLVGEATRTCTACGNSESKEVPATGHTEVVDKAVVPTCTKTGMTEGKHCSVCNEVLVAQTVVKANGHTEVIDKAVAPTCTATGLTEGKHCSVCNEVLVAQTVVKANGHTEVIDKAVAPTCTETGLTEGKHCSVCNETLVAQTVVKANGHTPGAAATCTTNQTCTVCKVEMKAALGHDMIRDEEIPATCTTPGSQAGAHCSRCDYTEGSNVIPALGHTEVIDAAVAPTCTETGLTEGKHCSVCNEVLVAQTVVAAKGHTPGAAATCTTNQICTICKVELNPAKGHTEVIDAAVAPTCTATGLTEGKHCSVCNEVLIAQTIVKANGHTEVIDAAVAPTCTATGLTEGKHCSVCKEVLVAQTVVKANGHTEVIDAAVAPTCTETGLTEGKHCTVCNEVLIAQTVVAARGHTEVIDAAVAPTCTETGLTEGKHCSVCKEVLVVQTVVEALGHSYDEGVITTEPACETEGVKTFTCATCGDAYTEAVDSTGHAAGEGVVENQVAATCTTAGSYETVEYCSVCNAELSRETIIVDALGHTEVIIEAVAPTCTETGLTEGKHCSVCNEILTAQEEIPATGHDYSIGICQTCGDTTKADYELFAAKSLTLKVTNPDTGKAYTSKQLSWALAEEYAPFATVSKTGKITAKKVVEKTRVEVVGTVKATEEKISYLVDIYPAVTQLEVKQDEKIANGKTLLMDFAEESITLKADAYPLDTLENVTWTVSDAKKQQYAEYTIDADTLTISNPKGKAGTVTIKATINAGVKKTVTVKVQFGSFAKTVEIAQPEKTTIRGGETLVLSAAITDPETVTKPGLVWSVSDKTAATVSNGKVKAKNVAHPTTVTVTAISKDGQASDSIEIEILPKNEGQLVLMNGNQFVTNTTKALNVGDTYQLSAAVITNGEPVPVAATWTTSKDTVAVVSDGLITATGAGTAKITAEYNGMKAVINIKVSTLVDAMEISTKDSKNIIEENGENVVIVSSGKAVNLVANVLTAGANKAVTWEITEGGQCAKIATSGKLTANKNLTSVQYITVKATAKDGSGASATIRVKLLPLATGVQIYQNGTRVRSNTVFVYDMLQGNTLKLNAKVYPAKANQAVQLTSSNKKIANFNENGELECYKPGTVTITAKALDGSNAKTTFKLTIVKRVTSLTLKEGSSLTVIGGKTLKLAPMVQINPGDATNKKLTWKVAPNDYGIKISTSGVLTTKRVTQSVTVNIMVTTKDGSGKMLSFDVVVMP